MFSNLNGYLIYDSIGETKTNSLTLERRTTLKYQNREGGNKKVGIETVVEVISKRSKTVSRNSNHDTGT